MNSHLIDIENLKKLSGNDADFVLEILKLYTERSSIDIKELREAIQNEDWNSVRFVVHRMRSAAVPLGLKDLVVSLKRIELGIDQLSPDQISRQVDEVIEITSHAMRDAREKLDFNLV